MDYPWIIRESSLNHPQPGTAEHSPGASDHRRAAGAGTASTPITGGRGGGCPHGGLLPIHSVGKTIFRDGNPW